MMVKDILQLESAGASVDQAVETALEKLGCTRAETETDILQLPSAGFLGLFGRREARVRVTLTDRGYVARRILEQLLALAGLPARVSVRPGREAIDLIIESEESSLVIGRHGQTLDALQSLTVALTDRQVADRTRLTVDIDNYRVRRARFLRRLANRLSSQAKKSGKAVSTDPLPPDERRIIHQALKQEADIEFRSVGQGFERKVLISACGG